MTNIKLEAMEKKIEDILIHTDLKEWQIEDITKELLDLYIVSKLELLNDMLMNQEEVISSPIRFNGVSIEKLKQIFEKNGVKYESPF
jgi:hypothetical protein